MVRGSFANFGTITKKDFAFRVFNHGTPNKNFIFITVVNFPVVIYGLRGEKSNIRMEITKHIFGVPSYQNGGVFRRNLTASGVGENIIF